LPKSEDRRWTRLAELPPRFPGKNKVAALIQSAVAIPILHYIKQPPVLFSENILEKPRLVYTKTAYTLSGLNIRRQRPARGPPQLFKTMITDLTALEIANAFPV